MFLHNEIPDFVKGRLFFLEGLFCLSSARGWWLHPIRIARKQGEGVLFLNLPLTFTSVQMRIFLVSWIPSSGCFLRESLYSRRVGSEGSTIRSSVPLILPCDIILKDLSIMDSITAQDIKFLNKGICMTSNGDCWSVLSSLISFSLRITSYLL